MRGLIYRLLGVEPVSGDILLYAAYGARAMSQDASLEAPIRAIAQLAFPAYVGMLEGDALEVWEYLDSSSTKDNTNGEATQATQAEDALA